MKSKWKSRLTNALFFGGVIVLFLATAGFILDAMTIQNVLIAWILFGIILFGIIALVAGMVLYILFNKNKIAAFFKKIANR